MDSVPCIAKGKQMKQEEQDKSANKGRHLLVWKQLPPCHKHEEIFQKTARFFFLLLFLLLGCHRVHECWDTLRVTPMVAFYSCLIHADVSWAHLWNQHSNSNSILFCVFLNQLWACFWILCVVFSFYTAFLISSNEKDILEIIPNLLFCPVFSSCHCFLLPLLPLYGVAFCHLQLCVCACVYIYVCYTCVYVSICKYIYMNNIHSSLSQICLFPFANKIFPDLWK